MARVRCLLPDWPEAAAGPTAALDLDQESSGLVAAIAIGAMQSHLQKEAVDQEEAVEERQQDL